MSFNSPTIKVRSQSFHSDDVSRVEFSARQRAVVLTLFAMKTYVAREPHIDSDSVLAHEVITLIYEKSSKYLQRRAKTNYGNIYFSICSCVPVVTTVRK